MKDPQRRRDEEPEANGPLGAPPESFSDELIVVWNELEGIVPDNVLARADRWTVELSCRMMLALRKGNFRAAELNILLSCLSRMGLTPADRSRIAVPKPTQETDELAELALEGKASHVLKPN